MSDSLNPKVVKIVSPYQVIVNVGSDHKISKGQKFLIYTLGEMITDPDTGEELETVEIVRGTGRAIHVQQKISTIESDMIQSTPVTTKRKTGLGSMAWAVGDFEETELKKEELPFNEAQVGDLVRLMPNR
ncbi:MAG: hypothetical protein Q8O14_14650 [bacterium]|nr:hypothetical protein [bacterium]